MKREDIITIGKVTKPDGVKGHLRPDVELAYEKSLEKAPFVFIFLDGLPVPFKVIDCNPDRDYSLKLESVDSPEQASRFNNLPLGLHEKHVLASKKFSRKTGESWTGYVLKDQGHVAGIVMEVVKFPGQTMMVIEKSNGQTLHIPLVEDWVDKVDHENQVLDMHLPEGLLDV